MPEAKMGESKGNAATLVAIAGLMVSLVGNYIQYSKNASDAQIAKQQVEIAQQQANNAREELALKQQQIGDQRQVQNMATQNCEQKRAERDDALQAVHMYEQSITKHEGSLQAENMQLAMAQTDQNKFKIAEHKSLAELEQNSIKSLKDSRDLAMARVKDIEQLCRF
jgi:hypothetical protein